MAQQTLRHDGHGRTHMMMIVDGSMSKGTGSEFVGPPTKECKLVKEKSQ